MTITVHPKDIKLLLSKCIRGNPMHKREPYAS